MSIWFPNKNFPSLLCITGVMLAIWNQGAIRSLSRDYFELLVWNSSMGLSRDYHPVHTNPFLFESGDFPSGFAYRPPFFGKTGTENTSFKNAPQSGELWKRWLLVYVWTGENRGFRIQWCHTSHHACSVRDTIVFASCIVLAFFVDGRKWFKYAK